MNFKELGIIDPILKALEAQGYQSPSPIQEQAIPHLLQNRDLLGCAQTGTGKTAAFAVPILQQLAAEKKPSHAPVRALILTPTRELALQIEESFTDYGRYLNLKTTSIFGGVSQNPQVQKLNRGVDIVVATPGRLNDLISQGLISLKYISVFVLDEADRMLDMGFVHDVKKIIALLPAKRQNLLFSATMPVEVKGLINSILKDYVTITVAPVSSTVDIIDQTVYYIDKGNKQKLLIDLLKKGDIDSALVFTRTKHGADRVVKELARENILARAIHGNKSQGARQEALQQFKSRTIQVLVATDIAARGIDIEELSHVFNYDLPNIPETYVHRIGRTGRAGLGGTAISFCMFDEIPYLKDIEKLIGKQVPVVKEHAYPLQIRVATPVEPPRSRRSPQPGGNQGAKEVTRRKISDSRQAGKSSDKKFGEKKSDRQFGDKPYGKQSSGGGSQGAKRSTRSRFAPK